MNACRFIRVASQSVIQADMCSTTAIVD